MVKIFIWAPFSEQREIIETIFGFKIIKSYFDVKYFSPFLPPRPTSLCSSQRLLLWSDHIDPITHVRT